jgi:hypothetical protein
MRWPLRGRDAELRLVDEALSGGSAGGVVIAGPTGVGKTRLAAAAAELAATEGCAVEWVRASRSARSIPLGAFATLLPAMDRRLPEGAELLARARQALAERAAGRRLVLCVDDGHLLDDASATLVHQLVAAAEAFTVLSLRRDEPAPHALRALWKDELCVLLELAELPRDEVRSLLEAGLNGSIDGRTAAALWERTRGNVLFLRELVRHGVDRGLLAHHGGVWRWRGEIEAGTRLPELVDLRVDDLGESERRLMELVAVGAPHAGARVAPCRPPCRGDGVVGERVRPAPTGQVRGGHGGRGERPGADLAREGPGPHRAALLPRERRAPPRRRRRRNAGLRPRRSRPGRGTGR